MTVGVLISALAFGQLMMKVAETGRAERAEHARKLVASRPVPRAKPDTPLAGKPERRTAKLEGPRERREARDRRRCRRLLRTEWDRMRKIRNGRGRIADAQIVYRRLPARCRRMMARR